MGSCVMSGLGASAIMVAGPLLESWGVEVFYVALSLDITFTLAAYIPMFPAFLSLRRMDPDTPRPFRVPGGRTASLAVCWVPVIELVLSIAISAIPLGLSESELGKLPLLAGSIIVVILGEVVRHVSYERAGTRAAAAVLVRRMRRRCLARASCDREGPEAQRRTSGRGGSRAGAVGRNR